jgi:hypothetical protein
MDSTSDIWPLIDGQAGYKKKVSTLNLYSTKMLLYYNGNFRNILLPSAFCMFGPSTRNSQYHLYMKHSEY